MFLTEYEAEMVSKALDLIRDPEHWCRATFARNDEGQSVEPIGSSATQWCAKGALYKFSFSLAFSPDLETKLNRIADEMYDPTTYMSAETIADMQAYAPGPPVGNYVSVNDMLGHEAIIALFEKALVKL